MTATTHVGTPYRPDRRAAVDLAWRAALVVVAGVAAGVEAPVWLRLPLSAVAAVAVALAYAVRARRRGALHTALVAVGGAIVLVMLLGLVLNLLPIGLSAAGWAVGTAVVELVVLGVLALRRPSASLAGARRPSRSSLVWGAAVVLVLAGAVAWSAASFTETHVAPLALAAEPQGAATRVVVSAGADSGPYRLELVTEQGRTVLARDVRVGPDRSASTIVRLPAGTRALVQLVPQQGSGAVRELILDTSGGAS